MRPLIIHLIGFHSLSTQLITLSRWLSHPQRRVHFCHHFGKEESMCQRLEPGDPPETSPCPKLLKSPTFLGVGVSKNLAPFRNLKSAMGRRVSTAKVFWV